MPLRSRLIRIGVISAILIVAASLFAVFFRIVPRAPEHKLFMSVRAPQQMVDGETTAIRFIVWNAGEEPVKRVVVALNRTYLSKFIFESIDPQPTSIVPTSSTRYYHYGPLRPGQDFRFQMTLTARRSGAHRLRAQLYSEQGLERRVEADTTILP